jgi:hypothetical protein
MGRNNSYHHLNDEIIGYFENNSAVVPAASGQMNSESSIKNALISMDLKEMSASIQMC